MAKTTMKLLGPLFALLLAAGCGNYSNADVDFQLAVPEREDLSAKLPAQYALVAADAAEYLQLTHQMVGVFNRFIDSVTSVVDQARVYPASVRQGDRRVWGPFPAERDPAWELRLSITRGRDPSADAGYRFSYAIEFHKKGDPGAWLPFLSGTFAPGGGARRGSGQFELSLTAARAAGFPVTEFGELEALRVQYQRMAFPHSVQMTIENVSSAETPRATVTYSEEESGAGAMTFVWRLRDNILVQALGIKTQWLPDGSGRGDARVVEGALGIGGALAPVGIDCWGPDGRNTYLRRDFANPRREEGALASCVLPAAPP